MKYCGVYRVTMLDWVCPYCDHFHRELDLNQLDHGAEDMFCKKCRETSRGTLQGDTNEWKEIINRRQNQAG
ncbi:MAG: hypothetical protein ACXABY_34155 [Candidatus Thorarchaeota archaeon]